MLDILNHHSLIREIMYVSNNRYTSDYKEFKLQTMKDNLNLLDEETIMKINELVVGAALDLVLKKNEKLQIIQTPSFSRLIYISLLIII